jgi:hypothetical protein
MAYHEHPMPIAQGTPCLESRPGSKRNDHFYLQDIYQIGKNPTTVPLHVL